MHTRRSTRLAAGAVALVIALALTPLPAAAVFVDVAVVSGTLTLKRPAGSVIDTVDLADPMTQCGVTFSTVSTLGHINAGTISIDLRFDLAAEVNGQDFVVDLIVQLQGAYGSSPPTYAIGGGSLGGSATMTAIRSTGSGSCAPLSGAGFCTMTATFIGWTGTLSASDASNLLLGDTATLSGGNPAFATNVAGTATNCGTLAALNNGSIAFTNVSAVVL